MKKGTVVPPEAFVVSAFRVASSSVFFACFLLLLSACSSVLVGSLSCGFKFRSMLQCFWDSPLQGR